LAGSKKGDVEKGEGQGRRQEAGAGAGVKMINEK
jgi:hypothetical protein